MGPRPALRLVGLGQKQPRASDYREAEVELDAGICIPLLSPTTGRCFAAIFGVAFRWLSQRLPSSRPKQNK